MTCPKCGHAMQVSDWPWCPHGRGVTGAIGDEFIGGRVYENLGHEPVYIESRSHLKRELQARGLVEMVRHVPIPGTDKSPHTVSWTSVDLEGATALAERQARTKATSRESEPSAATVAAVKRAFEEARAR
jgi:hypothetical protein